MPVPVVRVFFPQKTAILFKVSVQLVPKLPANQCKKQTDCRNADEQNQQKGFLLGCQNGENLPPHQQ